MKLSMWMIANQLLDLEPQLEISEDAPVILNSARLAYATNCVYLYQEGNDVVCCGEGDLIKIQGMELNRVFELIQAIFDAHEDWLAAVEQLLRQQDYQGMIETAHKLIKNPLILFDANSKVLGMTRQYEENSMDSEWAYLHRYGYSSLNALNLIRRSYGNINFYEDGQLAFHFSHNNLMQYPGISSSIYFNDILCGRLNLLAKNRPLNPGDAQLVTQLRKLLEPSLGQLFFQNAVDNSGNVFLNILLNKPYDEKKLQLQLAYQKWKEGDTFFITLVHLQEENIRHGASNSPNVLLQLLSQNLPHTLIIRRPPNLVVFSTENLMESSVSRDFLKRLAENNPLQIGFSLPLQGLFHTPVLYRQAEYAIRRGKIRHPRQLLHNFRDYALDYLLTADIPLPEKRFACMPEVMAMWIQKKKRNDEMFQTLKTFLDCERSIPNTAAALFLHRNTVVYRIKKIQNILCGNLDDPKERQYCWISLQILEFCDLEDESGIP